MRRAILLIAALAAVLLIPIASAQTAFRCDANGTTVYSDKPCPPGNVSKTVTSTQESPEQKAASKAANEQMRKDNADLNKRLTEREKLDAKERADARKAAAKLRPEVAKQKPNKAARSKAIKDGKALKNKALKKSNQKKTKSGNGTVTEKS